VAEQLLIRVLKRANELIKSDNKLSASNALLYFLNNDIVKESFTSEGLEVFSKLDDYDIISALKEWQYHDDFVLSNLSDMIINRELLKIKIKKKPIKTLKINKHIDALKNTYNISTKEAEYFVFKGKITNQAYQRNSQQIKVLYKTGKVVEVAKASDYLNLKALAKPVTKYYICFPKTKL
jgi:hypothetical protein